MAWRNLWSVTSAFCAGVFRQLIRALTLACVGAGSDDQGGFVVNGVTAVVPSSTTKVLVSLSCVEAET